MPVLSVTIPTARAQALFMAALKRGIEADTVNVIGDTTYIDLIGAESKIVSAAEEVKPVGVIDLVARVPHHEPLFTLVGRQGFDE